jgi:glycosyltransferase involved in cell wall biosynthesis
MMDGLPRASVIVPVYNAQDTIAECLDSLLALDYPEENLELIVVDNASTDSTADVLRGYSARVKVLFEEKRGASAARNRGLIQAIGEVAALTDADCVVDPGWLRAIVAPLREESIGVAGGRILAKRPCNWVERFGEVIHDHDRAINEFEPGYVITMNWASRLHVLKEAGLFDEAFSRGQDSELSWRILQRGYRFAYAPEAIVYHRNEPSLPALFGEGWVHGFHAPRLFKKHRAFAEQNGHRKLYHGNYRAILASLFDYTRRRNPEHSICFAAFNIGKEAGRLVGIVRWFWLDQSR